jgi:probable phosphoglycerate mutase
MGLAQGHNDQAELTSRGQRQAADVAERFRGLPVGALYASDLRRAVATATPLAAAVGVPVVLDTRLRERSLGVLEGSPTDSIGPSVTGVSRGRVADPDAGPEGGESIRDLYRRAAAFCGDLAAEGNVLVVAHGGTLRVLTAYLSGVPVEEMAWEPLENASVMRIPSGMRSRGGIR